MLGDGEGGEHGLAAGHLHDTQCGRLLRGRLRDVDAVELDATGDRMHEARHGLEQGRLAGTVGAEKGDDLTFVHLEVHPEQHLHLVVGDVDTTAGEQRRARLLAGPGVLPVGGRTAEEPHRAASTPASAVRTADSSSSTRLSAMSDGTWILCR